MVVVRVPVAPALLHWAVDRAALDPESVDKKFPKFTAWVDGSIQPTLKQLENFAHATHAPLGYLFLSHPPDEVLPIPDYRTVRNAAISQPSPDLLDTIHNCQTRQDWFRNFATSHNYESIPFVGSETVDSPVEPVADIIRRQLDFGLNRRGEFNNWETAFRSLIDSIEELGVLVMVSGIVGGDTHRGLKPEEFRGFALSDPVAPLIFVNGADAKSAQFFTMIHELAHIWLGQTALSDAPMADATTNASEIWCNKVAAEVLVPLSSIRNDFRGDANLDELRRLSSQFRVSTLVILKRIFDAGFLQWDDYRHRYGVELDRVREIVRKQRLVPGGNYYFTQPLRISRQFGRAVMIDTYEGGTLHRDAYRLLGTAKHETFVKLAEELGVSV